MYLARKQTNRTTRFFIRESYRDGKLLKCRDLFDLGDNPARYIIYPGGNSYYYDDIIEDTLEKKGRPTTQDELDPILWSFLDSRIQRVVQSFQRSRKTNVIQECRSKPEHHIFDKRRIHYLKFGQLDQGGLSGTPTKLFSILQDKSRDEMEQYFWSAEKVLAPREYTTYTYVIFDLQRRFGSQIARMAPGALDTDKLDSYFIQELCKLDEDETFWAGLEPSQGLHGYLKRYASMYFDNAFPQQSPFPEYLREFMDRRRFYRPPKKVRLKKAEAASLFGQAWNKLNEMDRGQLTRLYRKLALKHHPDQGGDPKRFVKLTEAYQHLLRKKG